LSPILSAGSKQKVMTVSADEFLRRFLIHVLPKGLVRIRHFGPQAVRFAAASPRAAQRRRATTTTRTNSSDQVPALL